MNKFALGIMLACAGCSAHTGPSPREMKAMQEEQMKQAMQMMQSQMEGVQDVMAGKDTEAARAYKKQSEAMTLQGKQMEEQLRKDPRGTFKRSKSRNASNASSCAKIPPASKPSSS